MSTSVASNDLTVFTTSTPNGVKPTIKENPYLKVNPNGKIPALKDGELRVFESGAIMLYQVDQYDTENTISYPKTDPSYYEMLSWLIFQVAGVGPMQGQANHFLTMASVYSGYSRKRYIDETKRLYDVLEARLSESEWLAGDKYTIADIASCSWVKTAPGILDLDLSPWTKITQWMAKIDARPAVQKAREVTGITGNEEEVYENFARLRDQVKALKDNDGHEY